MSASEMEAKRQAMQKNAKERDREREDNVRKYQAEEANEAQVNSSKPQEADFVK
jgi:hypothetical protein